MNKVQDILNTHNQLKIDYYKKKAHKGIIGTEKELSLNEVNDLINDFVNFEMEWRVKTDSNDVEHFYFTDINDIEHYLETNEENLNQVYTLLYIWYKRILDFEGSLNIGDYNIVRTFYIYDFQCENLVFGDGLLSDIFEEYLNTNDFHQAEPIFDFFNDYEIEIR